MEYTVKQLGDLAGVSGRTLRYYDQIDLLKPSWVNESGYRMYGPKEVDRLQQILFYRELGVELSTIRTLLDSPNFTEENALREHHKQLLEKRRQLDLLLQNVEKTLAALEGGRAMTDKEKFIGFKETLIRENEEKYGKEIREKYGDETVDASNAKLMGLTEAEYAEMQQLAVEIIDSLAKAVGNTDPEGPEGRRIAELHRKWLGFTWKEYSKAAHAGLAEMYVADERFTAYYDQHKEGAAQFLRDAIVAYAR
ncbi:MAG: MerR family transcriptional regulator [Firmicutes bacterium]|nr:MerR family transcriptional regulator [Bacillota bacterium]